MKELKIGTSWVRGVVGEALTPELAVNFASAFGTWCSGGAVVISRDTRRSSIMIRSAAVAGLLSAGCEVIDLGIETSPLLSFAIREIAASGGIAITGSHNDARWNALKFFGPDGALINAAKSEELLDLYHSSAFLRASWDRIRPLSGVEGIEDRYVSNVLAFLDVEAIRARRFRVAVDFCNGACGPSARRLLEALRCTLLPVNEEPTGEFAHAPAPSVSNMRQLASLMRWCQADLGAAVNVDGDRIGFVTASAEALSEEYSLPLAAEIRLRRRPGPIVTNLSTSRMIDFVATAHGQRVVRTMVGESSVVDQGLAEGAVLSGEGSGGVAPLPVSMTFDALLALGLILEYMATTGESLSSLAGCLPRLHMRKHEMACPPTLVYRVLDRFRVRYPDIEPDCRDGVRFVWEDTWLHVRASNTEPMLRILVESESGERAAQLLEESITFARRAAFGQGGN